MITVFLATFNRLETLERTVRSYERFSGYELVIIDNGSDHPACLDLLERLAKRPDVKKVYNLTKINSMQELTDNFSLALKDQYNSRTRPRWFAVTDADVSFESTSPGALAAYVTMAKQTGCAAGPHLGVDPLPPIGYPLRSRVLATETRLLYRDKMNWVGKIPFTFCPIDTTFQVFPRRADFPRLKMSTVRVGYPYWAMHLDWHIDFFSPTEEDLIYIQHEGSVGSWGCGWIKGFWLLFQKDRERAFDDLAHSARNPHDFCNVSFMLSWCHQYGIGTPVDLEASKTYLKYAIPGHQMEFLAHESEWMRMIYEDDLSVLGWNE